MSHQDDSSSSTFKLILPDLSGIAQLVDDFSLPTFDTSLREIVSAHEEHNQSIQRLIHQIMEEQEELSRKLMNIHNRIDKISNRVDIIADRFDSMVDMVKQEPIESPKIVIVKSPVINSPFIDNPIIDSPLLIPSPINMYEPDMIEVNYSYPDPEPEPEQAPEPEPEHEGKSTIDNDISELPKVYYTVNPTFGTEAINTKGKVVMKGDHIKIVGELTIPNNEDNELFFDNVLGGYIATKVEYCRINYADKNIDQISLEELDNGRVKINMSEIDEKLFPLELSYRIEYRFSEK